MRERVRATMVVVMSGVLLAAFPAAAQAAQDNPVNGTTNGDMSWTTYTRVRHDVDGTSIIFKPTLLPPGGMCMALRNNNSGAAFGHGPCWSAGDYSAKAVASGVPANTEFRVMARQRASSWGTSQWSGILRY
ncbi:hypothetical protein [Actinoplanes sp. G11-F43]|uniref:hypothetical protein n=1 Tax=Actinoplanes sp. G11-F43 TaxID=3424130 RepID=UPI003D33F727